MGQDLRQLLVICIGMVLMLSSGSVLYAKAGLTKVDARILIDISGSMKKNDPQNLRRSALRLLVGLMPDGNRAGVWTFGQYINMQVPLGQIDGTWKKRARKQAGKIHSRGLFTDIEEALRRATKNWDKPGAGYRRDIVLLTDGMVDISKDKARNDASRKRILTKILPQLKNMAARVHTIALSERADHDLMRKLAAETNGWYEQVTDADRLQRVFLRMFEKVSRPDTVPLKDNRFEIDSSIKEVTLLVFRSPGKSKPTMIITPSGKKYGVDDVPAWINWYQDQGYDLLTISKPEPGEWSIQADVDPDNRVMIVTDLKMHTLELPNRLAQGEQFLLIAQFSDKGKKITRRNFLQVVEVKGEYQIEDGLSETYQLRDDGQGADKTAWDGNFNTVLKGGLMPGNGTLVITAEGKTFKRERRQDFVVRTPVAVAITEQSQDGVNGAAITLIPDEKVIRSDSLSPIAWLQAADGSRAGVILVPDGMGGWQAWMDTSAMTGTHKLWVSLSATSQTGNTVQLEIDSGTVQGSAPETVVKPVEKQQEEEPEIAKDEEKIAPSEGGWMPTVMYFAAINLVVIGTGVAGYIFYRRRKNDGLVQLVDAEDDGKEE
ncbi:FIG00786757: hypothetical protein [hydrothermal vent metagenome]|uniref:VWFA domain-containing protein n=1 Tax=hydrothermal vent metagenome TaxID=652676 RepID=A0A3B1B777_9ZZZZ